MVAGYLILLAMHSTGAIPTHSSNRASMFVPGYRWLCHKCGLPNEPGTSACDHCQFPAVASAIDVARAKNEPDPRPRRLLAVLAELGWWAAFLALFGH